MCAAAHTALRLCFSVAGARAKPRLRGVDVRGLVNFRVGRGWRRVRGTTMALALRRVERGFQGG
jgi:hypothetical protein